MPAMMVWPESMSVRTLKVGSSCASLASAMPIFSWSALVFGSTATSITGFGKSIDSSTIGCLVGADRVAGDQVLEADGGADIAREDLGDLFALVGVHLQQTADALRLAGARIQHRVAGLQLARVDADEDQLADERVGHDLEAERGRTARCRPPCG